jgi:hypothetical protein
MSGGLQHRAFHSQCIGSPSRPTRVDRPNDACPRRGSASAPAPFTRRVIGTPLSGYRRRRFLFSSIRSRHSFASGGIVQRCTQRKRDGRRLFIFFEPSALFRTALSRRDPRRPPPSGAASPTGTRERPHDRSHDSGSPARLRPRVSRRWTTAAASACVRSAPERLGPARLGQKNGPGNVPGPHLHPSCRWHPRPARPSVACAQNSMPH